MTEAQHWRRIARWVAEQPSQQTYALPLGLDMTDPMFARLCEHIWEGLPHRIAMTKPGQYQTYIIMRCELLALEAEEEGV
jgi:hypothetical protein